MASFFVACIKSLSSATSTLVGLVLGLVLTTQPSWRVGRHFFAALLPSGTPARRRLHDRAGRRPSVPTKARGAPSLMCGDLNSPVAVADPISVVLSSILGQSGSKLSKPGIILPDHSFLHNTPSTIYNISRSTRSSSEAHLKAVGCQSSETSCPGPRVHAGRESSGSLGRMKAHREESLRGGGRGQDLANIIGRLNPFPPDITPTLHRSLHAGLRTPLCKKQENESSRQEAG